MVVDGGNFHFRELPHFNVRLEWGGYAMMDIFDFAVVFHALAGCLEGKHPTGKD